MAPRRGAMFVLLEACPHSESYRVRCPPSQGTWDDGSAGGGMGQPGYYTNPQYAVVLTHPKTKVHIELRAPREVSRGHSFTHHHPSVVICDSPLLVDNFSLGALRR